MVLRTEREGSIRFGVSQQSREALRTLTAVRRAVADEVPRVADATRTLAAAAMTAAVGNIGLIVARLTVAKTSTFLFAAAVVIGVALAMYVDVVIASGAQFLAIQRSLRRERFYRLLPVDDYRKLVEAPGGRAELAFLVAAAGSVVVTLPVLPALVVVAVRLLPRGWSG